MPAIQKTTLQRISQKATSTRVITVERQEDTQFFKFIGILDTEHIPTEGSGSFAAPEHSTVPLETQDHAHGWFTQQVNISLADGYKETR
jgi:hypothetical protein